MADVLAQLECNRQGFQTLSKQYGGVMQLVCYFYTRYPGLHFQESLVTALADYTLAIDFDFYHLYSDVREDSD